MNVSDSVALLRETVGYPTEVIEWGALVGDADRRAAALITQFAHEHKELGQPPVEETPAFGLMRMCSPPETGALVTALFATMRAPAWAAALGLKWVRPITGEFATLISLLHRLLRRKCELSHVRHRVLLVGLAEHHRSLNSSIEPLERLVIKHATAHPGINEVELRNLFKAVGGEDSIRSLALLLRAPLGIVTPTRFTVPDISPEQHKLLAEWADHWAAIHAEISDPAGQDASIGRYVSEFLDIHAAVFRRHSGKSPYAEVEFHYEFLVHDQLAGFMEHTLIFYEQVERTFDREWFRARADAYAAWRALEPDARWWVDISGADAAGANQTPALLSGTFGPTEPLFELLRQVTSVKPSAKWLRSAAILCASSEGAAIRHAIMTWLESLASSGKPAGWVRQWQYAARFKAFAEAVLPVIEVYGSPRSAVLRGMCMERLRLYSDESGDFGSRAPNASALTDQATDSARGAVWALTNWQDDETAAIIAKTAERLLVRLGTGYRSLAAANACILALSEIGTPAAIMSLDRLKRSTRDGSVAKQLDKAKARAAEKAGLTISELEELSTPVHDLDLDGRLELPVGDGAALIAIDGTASVALNWRTLEGKITKSLPAAMKGAKDEVKAAKAKAAAIESDLSILPWRLQRLWLEERRWTPEAWRHRYVEHPLAGAISRRLIWNTQSGERHLAGVWRDGALVGLDGKPIRLDDAVISLWHPATCDVTEVMAWRGRLDELGIVQPFKQAHREIYLLTDAERRTNVYSNRFAGHIVKQQPMMALARLNGWSMAVHLGYDGGHGKYPSRLALPHAGLIAEYWLEGVGGNDDYTANGSHLYLSTDQLRFVRPTDMARASRSLGTRWRDIDGMAAPMEEVPPLLLSEIMRHCDLFVGVASIANDPDWIDAGVRVRDGHWRQQADEYWRDRSFGEIGASGETRRDLLLALLPSLALGKVLRIDGNYLRVEGKLRAYKIHLGSGNIQMEPNDQYLCIVPAAGGASEKKPVALPFEGDTLLSIILSKAALLAADDKITDPTILSQIRR